MAPLNDTTANRQIKIDEKAGLIPGHRDILFIGISILGTDRCSF